VTRPRKGDPHPVAESIGNVTAGYSEEQEALDRIRELLPIRAVDLQS